MWRRLLPISQQETQPSVYVGHQSSTRAQLTDQFQTIYAVSADDPNDATAWRRTGLLAAAERTGLQIEVPAQRAPSEESIRRLQQGKETEKRPGDGGARAWLAHLDVLDR